MAVSTVAEEIENGGGEVDFPYEDHKPRLDRYRYYQQLLEGDHWNAFSMRVQDENFNEQYSMLKFVQVNFAGLISRICADMLFGEPITITVPDGGDADYIEGLWVENDMDTQCYESTLENSAAGDAFFKVRSGPVSKDSEEAMVFIEDLNPAFVFPKYPGNNTRARLEECELAWKFKKGDKEYVRKEIHYIGTIKNEVWLLEAGKLKQQLKDEEIKALLGVDVWEAEVETGINELLIIHIPNYRTVHSAFGISDYRDIDTLFYAINNRISKIDNILDKHSDPILMVPPGILDEDGKVKKKHLGVIQKEEGEDDDPAYITWDASLESAFSEIEKLVEFVYMIGEVSPDILGMGKGVSDSGRALKYKLIRTIAKVSRKKLYYNTGLRQVLYVAQLLGKSEGIAINGKKLAKEPVMPDLQFADGLPNNFDEQVIAEAQAVEAELTSRKEAIMRLHQVDEKKAEEMMKNIKDENPGIEVPTSNIGKDNVFDKKTPNQQANEV